MSRAISSPIGHLVDVEGHRMHSYVLGKGEPTIVFEAGGAGWSLDWYPVQTAVSEFTRTCSYDRAGLGWSDPGPKPRTSEKMAKELHILLANSGINQPYILIGASFGGHVVRLYADKYPDEVVGIVLLDARQETINSRMSPAWKQLESTGKVMYRFMLSASRLKLLKAIGSLLGGKALPPIINKLPPDIRSAYLEVVSQPKYFECNLDELAACAESDDQVSKTGSLDSIPLIVIRHGIPDMFSKMPPEKAREAEHIWQQLQIELSQLSANSQVLVAEKSGHGIHYDEPVLVVEVIRQMVETVRGGKP